jgi:two-component system, cell cycle sensor histidine kinase and response regulator CckA
LERGLQVPRPAIERAGSAAAFPLLGELPLLADALERVTESVVLTDLEARILYVNAAFERVTGYSRAEVLGQNPRVLKSGSQSDAFYLEMWARLTAGETWNGEFVNRRADGTFYVEEASISPVRDARGAVTSYLAVKRDVTAERRAAHELRMSEERYRSTLDRMLEGAMIVDREWKVVYANQAAASQWHEDRHSMQGRPVTDYMPPGGDTEIRERMRECMEQRVPQTGEFEFAFRDGSSGWYQLSIEPVPQGIFLLWLDQTGQRRALDRLRESEARFRAVNDTASDGIVTVDSAFRIVGWNAAATRILGFDEADVMVRPLSILMPEDRIEAARALLDPMASTTTGEPQRGRPLEVEGRRKDGSLVPLEISLSGWEVSGARYLTAIIRDITRRRQAERALRESEALHRTVFTTMAEGVIALDVGGHVVASNPAAAAILGIPTVAMPGFRFEDPDLQLTTEDGRPLFLGERAEPLVRLAAGVRWQDITISLMRPDGRRVWLRVNAEPIIDETGAMTGTIASFTDTSERRARIEALRRASERLAASQAIARVGSWEMDVASGKATWSDEMYRLHGVEPGEFEPVGPEIERFFSPDTREAAVGAIRRAAQDGESSEVDVEILTAAGRRTVCHLITQVVAIEGKPVKVIGTLQDVTERRDLEARLRQAQKMEAVGQLAGGIAHDFNNLLTAIRGYGELALQELPADNPASADVSEMLRAADRAASMTRQLLAFSRRQVLEPQVLDPAAIVDGLAPMLRRLLGEHIELMTLRPTDVGRVRVDPGQLEQVIVNLAVNSRDAMPGGGRLKVSMSNVMLDATAAARPPEVAPGPFVRIQVTDTGTGMDAETQARIFEPFFTTKRPGEGTGMGLATVFGIVRQSGGRIACESRKGRGTTFTIELPRVDAPAAAAGAVSPDGGPVGGREMILLVEDEPAVRRVGARMLRSLGYRVVEADGAAEALALDGSTLDLVDLLVTDVVMPGTNGATLSDLITRDRPHIPTLFVSGYAPTAVIEPRLAEPNSAFLEKPFTAEALAGSVRRLLDGAEERARQRAPRAPKLRDAVR